MSGRSLEVEFRLRAHGPVGLLANARRLSQLRSPKNYPRTARAIFDLTKEAQSLMLRAVQGKPVHWLGGSFRLHRITGGLHGSILGGLRYPLDGNPLRGGIEVKIRYYRYIRDGIRPYDMKPGLLRSPKARISKTGVKYLVVPIRTSPHRFAERIFRIVTSQSKGWIHPGLPPKNLGAYAQETLRRRAARRIRDAMRADMQGR